jgi:hypothetical protein
VGGGWRLFDRDRLSVVQDEKVLEVGCATMGLCSTAPLKMVKMVPFVLRLLYYNFL